MNGGVKELVRKGIDEAFVGNVGGLFATLIDNMIEEGAGVEIENEPDKPITKFRRGLKVSVQAYDAALKETDSV